MKFTKVIIPFLVLLLLSSAGPALSQPALPSLNDDIMLHVAASTPALTTIEVWVGTPLAVAWVKSCSIGRRDNLDRQTIQFMQVSAGPDLLFSFYPDTIDAVFLAGYASDRIPSCLSMGLNPESHYLDFSNIITRPLQVLEDRVCLVR